MFFSFSCGNSSKHEKDEKERAEESNKAVFDKTGMEDDVQFVTDAADAGMLEVELGKLAQANGTLTEVKELGSMMVKDHSKANEELKDLAAKKNITIQPALSDKSHDTYNDLYAKSGRDFDDAYSDLMVNDHEKVLKAFRREAENGNDADIRSWATGKIATLEHHLEMSRQAEKSVGEKK
jgi:putative membrane protein